MTTNRFLAALRLLLGKPVARLTFPPGATVMPGSILIEGVGLQLRGWHIKQTFTTTRLVASAFSGTARSQGRGRQ